MRPRSVSFVSSILIAMLVVVARSHAASWTEVEDAGVIPANAQVPIGEGALDEIIGEVSFADVDMYKIYVTGGGTFSAVASGASPLFLDSQLHLFDATGHGVYANDDVSPPNPAFPPGLAVLPSGHALTPTEPGIYWLAISSYDLQPISSGGPIFPCVGCSPGAVAGPVGPGGGSPIMGWSGQAFTRGSYTIRLTGAEFVPACPAVAMSSDLTPSILNLRSRGRWVVATLEPQAPASPGDIDVSSILLNGSVPVDASGPTSIGDVDQDGLPELTVRFDRRAVELTVTEGEAVAVDVSGKIGSGCFTVRDTIRVISPNGTAPIADRALRAGDLTELHSDTAIDVLGAAPNTSSWGKVKANYRR